MVAILPQLTRVIAGVSVPNTPLINASIALAQQSLPQLGYEHVIRSFLNGQTIINNLPKSNQSKFDFEAFGVAALLHDLGWAFNTSFVSTGNIFEIDGANAARDFILEHGGHGWDKHRLQLVWDAIALHTDLDVCLHKQSEVAVVCAGVFTELVGPELAKQQYGDAYTVSQSQWDAIAAAFPRPGTKVYLDGVMIELCNIKPGKTYDNFVGDYCEKYVPGYNRTGHRFIDLLEATLP